MAARPAPGQAMGDPRRFNAKGWLLRTADFVSFPLAGIATQATVGRINDAVAALVGGLVAGAVIGTGQWLAARRSATRFGLAPHPGAPGDQPARRFAVGTAPAERAGPDGRITGVRRAAPHLPRTGRSVWAAASAAVRRWAGLHRRQVGVDRPAAVFRRVRRDHVALGVALDRLRRHPSRTIPAAPPASRNRLAVMSCAG
jgi:hypothetical protein